MRTLTALTLLAIASSVAAFALTVGAPEIDPASGASALALIACSVVVIRARRAR